MTYGTANTLDKGKLVMYFYFLIEDESGKRLIDAVMQKIQVEYKNVFYECKAFRGIGGFTKKNTVKETKTGKLLNDLTTYLKGFNKSLANTDSAVVVVLDNDDRNPKKFKSELTDVITRNSITLDHVFAIAVEEMEAWLLGDENALSAAYPSAKKSVLNEYVQDSICGTWEVLANAVYPGGLAKMKKACPTFREIGTIKAEWAEKIGVFINLDNNKSPSFNYFINEIKSRCSA